MAKANAMILAAGLGTRLRPITDTIPKALVPIAGRPLLDHILSKMRHDGFDNIVVNAHHHASQIVDYLEGSDVKVSCEEVLLDTGGGLRRAFPLFGNDLPVLVHNVDILSNADLCSLYEGFTPNHLAHLLVSDRETTRYLLFDDDMNMVGWVNENTGEVRSAYGNIDIKKYKKYAFSGIHVISQRAKELMKPLPEAFSIVDFYIQNCGISTIKGVFQDDLHLIDVGKMDSLRQAEEWVKG